MRVFTSEDGRSWIAVPVEVNEIPGPVAFGWQAVLFRTVAPDNAERFIYRPVGWLPDATPEDLRTALLEADGVRAHWGG